MFLPCILATAKATRLECVAVDHWNTDNPRTHVVLRGKDQACQDLIIARDYLTHGMREHAAELATERLPTHVADSRARSAIVATQRKGKPNVWLSGILARRDPNIAAAALANKNARTVWALLAHEREIRPDYVPQRTATA